MARLGVQNTCFGIPQCQEPISRQAGGVWFEKGAQIVLLQVREKTCERGCEFVHIYVAVKETETPRDRDSEKQKEMI